jgi:hypothetical protein
MPQGRCWTVTEPSGRGWQIKTARESEVYHRPVDATGRIMGVWRPGLPALEDMSVLPESLREVLDLFIAARHDQDESC